jgi:hypothetical protein
MFVCSHALGNSVAISTIDSVGSQIQNPAVYFDFLTITQGVTKSFFSKQWSACHDVQTVNSSSAYFLVSGS